MVEQLQDNTIKLKRVFVESKLPDALKPLRELGNNLWWSWNKDAIQLFEQILPHKWVSENYNPIAILDRLSLERARELMADKSYMDLLERVYSRFEAYMSKAPSAQPSVAYFSMEYGLQISVRLYSGGLGILAGDYLKEASDQNYPLTAVGLLYRYGYFQQSVSLHGDQINNFPPQQYTKLPIQPVRDENGEWKRVAITLPGRTVWAKIWRLAVGRVDLYLLDADIDENSWEDRALTHQLYGGDNEHRLKQEILLGIGGVRLLESLDYHARVYHCNEGHAAFMGLERIKNLMAHHDLGFEEALEMVRASSLFTTHTPVPAGHDYFSENLLHSYLASYIEALRISWDRFIGLGKINRSDHQELFSMSHLAIRLCQEVNGVSKLHGKVSQRMFKVLYPGYNQKEIHIGHVTNGVHYPTWIASEWHDILKGDDPDHFIGHQSEADQWRSIQEIPSETIQNIRQTLKERLLNHVRSSLKEGLTRRGENPSTIFNVLNGIDNKALVVGFARRFATYKRAHLLFRNIARLSRLVNDPDRPVIFIFAGKAHPADEPGQQLIKDIIQNSKRTEFAGKIIFLEGYNMEMAKLLVQGVDVWLNTPTRPKEASGTSGMKAAMNGVVNFSVLDGWWAEGYREDSGWALPLERTYQDQELQNELDAEMLYNIFETEIVPTYFGTKTDDNANEWITLVRNIMTKVAPNFTMKRMLDDYIERYYLKLEKYGSLMKSDNFRSAHDVVQLKKHLRQRWETIHVLEKEVYDTDNFSIRLGDQFKVRFKIYLDDIEPKDVKLEVIFFKRKSENNLDLRYKYEVPMVTHDDRSATFETQISMEFSGVYEYGYRLTPKSDLLGHQQCLELVKWL